VTRLFDRLTFQALAALADEGVLSVNTRPDLQVLGERVAHLDVERFWG
jgi:hypothetical protein